MGETLTASLTCSGQVAAYAALRMAPTQQSLAAGHTVVAEVDQRLVVELEAVVRHRLPQILLQRQPRLGVGIHGCLEKTMGAASPCLGRVHRKIGILDQLLEIGAVLRCQRDADAGVARELMAETSMWLPNRRIDLPDEGLDLGLALDRRLDDGEFVAAEPCNEISLLEAAPDPRCHALEKLVADMMTERVVDALELVDIDVEQGE